MPGTVSQKSKKSNPADGLIKMASDRYSPELLAFPAAIRKLVPSNHDY